MYNQMKYELALKQKQKLMLTPQLFQSIKILQLNLLELRNLIEQEIMENPLLEISTHHEVQGERDNSGENISGKVVEPEEKAEDNFLDYWVNYLEEEEDYPLPVDKSLPEKENLWENFLSDNMSLADYLLRQLGSAIDNDIDYKIGEYLIGNINDNGYLTTDLETISRDLNVKMEKVKEILILIQSFDPPGVGARSLEECLLIQKRYLNLPNQYLEEIIKHHLVDLAQRAYSKIARDLNISLSEVQNLADILKKSFDPKPGRRIDNSREIRYIIPDLILMKDEDRYRLIINEEFLPRLSINSLYKKYLSKDGPVSAEQFAGLIKRDKHSDQEMRDTIAYIKEKLHSARSLLRGIEQRKKTIYNIAEIIVEHQKDFLENGILYIRPLTLKEVADKLGIHESTVSRAIHNKTIQTSRGVLSLKFFFSRGVEGRGGRLTSAERIKRLIKQYIERENPYEPLSDKDLGDLLYQEEKIKLSRRTVNKYREALAIPASNFRRRFSV